MKSFADQIVSWPDAPGNASALVAGLSTASWLAEHVPAELAELDASRTGDRFDSDYVGALGEGSNAVQLITRLQETEALRGRPTDSPATIRLLQLSPTEGGAVQPPVPVWWLAVEACPGRKALSSALLVHIRQAIASMVAEGRNPKPYARCILIVSVAGPQRRRPDLVVIGPANGNDADARGATCIRSFQFSRMRTQGDAYVRSQAEDLAGGLTEGGLATFFNTSRAGDARHVVRNQLKDQLTELMQLLEGLPGAPNSNTSAGLRALREAATVVVFRMMFLGEIEARGLLWLRGTLRRHLFEAAADALDIEVEVHDESQDLVAIFLHLCGVLRGAASDQDVEVRGGSLFSTRPNEQFEARVIDYLSCLDEPSLNLAGDDRAQWRRVLAETFQITQGVVLNRGASVQDQARESLGYLGLGGTEHVHRILGDVYEQILALEPKRSKSGVIVLGEGDDTSQRKSLGAHYTPENLVEELVRPALGALFAHHWAACGEEVAAYAERVRSLRVVDPAMGSAHFLTVAARELATELEWLDRYGKPRHVEDPDAHEPLKQRDPLLGRSDSAEEAPIKAGLVRRLRDVVQRCCHGVDVSPIAVELGKLSLWLFTMTAQKERLADADIERPELAFLDANIQCGDSLIGLFWREVRPILNERFGVELMSRGAGPIQFGLFDPKGQLVADRVDEVSGLLERLHGDDAHLLAFGQGGHAALAGVDKSSPYAIRKAMHTWVQAQLADLRWVFDLATLAVFFNVRMSRRKVNADALEAALREAGDLGDIDWEAVISEPLETTSADVRTVRSALVRLATRGRFVNGRPIRAFHWGMAFPDVFAIEGGGFDLIVANPPFIGDRELRGRIGQSTTEFLTSVYTARRRGGTCDLAGFFVLRYADLLNSTTTSRGAVAASLGPNSLAQAKNRRAVLVPLLNGTEGFFVARAIRSMAWPGDAAVHICVMVLARNLQARQTLVLPSGDDWTATYSARISTFLDEFPDRVFDNEDAKDLPSGRASLFFQGLLQRGANGAARDFVKPIAEARAFLREAEEAGERDALYAYLNNEAVQNSRTATAQTICVDFYDVLQEAGLTAASASDQLAWLKENYSVCLSSIDDVRVARGGLPDTASNSAGTIPWWSHWRPRPELRKLWAHEETILVAGRAASKVWCLSDVARIDPVWDLPVWPSDALNVLPSSGTTAFAALQSALGEIHVRRNSSTLETRLRFSPEYALSGFPFPWRSHWSEDPQGPYPLPAPADAQARLNPAAERLSEVRNRLLADPETLLPEVHPVPADWGPTELYNRYDDSGFDAPGILPLRQAHQALLDAVLCAYAADASLPQAAPLFASLQHDMARAEDGGWCFDRPWIDGTERYVPKPEFRRRIIEALLHANVERWAQEIELIGTKLATAVSSDTVLARKLEKGIDAPSLTKVLESHPVTIHADDAQAVLDAGARSGKWVRFDHGGVPTYRWVGDSYKERERQQKAADSERRKVEEAAREEAEKYAPTQEDVEELRLRRRRVSSVATPTSLSLALPDVPSATTADPVVAFVLREARPLGRADILAGLGMAEESWPDVRRRLEHHPELVRLGINRGTRYIGWRVLLDRLVKAARSARQEEGTSKAQIVEEMAREHLAIDDETWRVAVQELLSTERIRKTGQARGTRYYVDAVEPGAIVIPFRRVHPRAEDRYVTCVPLIPLRAAAGAFSETQALDDEESEWVTLDGRSRPAPGLFVAQVVGESMNRRIPNGAWCLWRTNPAGTRQGKVVLAQHRDIDDPELGGRYTVKVYESEKVAAADGGWRHTVVRLKPDSNDPSFEPIVLRDVDDADLTIIAELVEVL